MNLPAASFAVPVSRQPPRTNCVESTVARLGISFPKKKKKKMKNKVKRTIAASLSSHRGKKKMLCSRDLLHYKTCYHDTR